MEIYIKPVGPIGTNCYIISEEGGGCAIRAHSRKN